MTTITPCLWFDDQAEAAAAFYTSLFDDAHIGAVTRYGEAGHEIHGREAGSVMSVDFTLAGHPFMALNGGPVFTFTPAISFFVTCETPEEVDRLWEDLLDGGEALMPLDRYDWSERYGWVRDRYGLTWQLSLGKLADVQQKITPALMYVGDHGMAEDAIDQYTSAFDDAGIVSILRYGPDAPQPEGTVMHAQFRLNGQGFMAMDTSSEFADFTFNEAVSLVVGCESQDEIDHFWEKLSEGGDERAQQCGWLKDRFGVSWQVFPGPVMGQIVKAAGEGAGERVMEAILQMKKIDLAALEAAAKS